MPREKSRYRTRSPSYASDSSYEKKRSKTRHKHRSKDRSSSQRRKRSSSRSRKRRSYSRSISPDRYESRSRRRSVSRSKRSDHRRSVSRDRSNRRSVSRDRSRSSSRSRSKYSKKSRSYRKSRSSSRSSSLELEKPIVQKKINLDDTEAKLEKAIKAAAAAGLSMTKIPTYEYKEVDVKEDMPSIHDRNLLAELNSDSFVPKSFSSSKSKKHQNIVIDLNTNTVIVPEADITTIKDDSIIDFSKIPDENELKEMWIRKLYLYRKKMLKGDI